MKSTMNPDLKPSRAALILAAALAALAVTAARAEVFKWVDENGVTNYGNAPPRAAKATPLDPATTNVSTYSRAEARQNADPSDGDAKLKQRVDALERELDAERRGRQTASELAVQQSAQQQARDAERKKLQRERCLADRRVDCDDPAVATGSNAVVPVVVVRNRPPAILPAVPITRPLPKPPVSVTPETSRPRTPRSRDRD